MQHQHHRADLGSDVKLFQFFRIQKLKNKQTHVHVCSLVSHVCDSPLSLSLSHNTAKRRLINTVTLGNFHWVICTGKLSLIFFFSAKTLDFGWLRWCFCPWDTDRNTVLFLGWGLTQVCEWGRWTEWAGTSVVTSWAINKRAYWPSSRREATGHMVRTGDVITEKQQRLRM